MSPTATIFDPTQCELGEGLLWHPERQQIFWFDILGSRLHTVDRGAPKHWQFDEHVSAAGWLDHEFLLVASQTKLFTFDLLSGARRIVAELEADRTDTRSNDGRADPWGGFWIGTMGKAAEPGAGAIYRYYQGEVRRLYGEITIPNAICFSPDRRYAYFTDTPTRVIQRQTLDADHGWPLGAPEPWLTLGPDEAPDGAVVDAAGNLWNAQWGLGRVACYAPDGTHLRTVDVPARLTTCPAFGGPDLTTLYVTSAREGLPAEVREAETAHGQTFAVEGVAAGQAEPKVLL